MAELTAFVYRPGGSILHVLDVRFKLLFLVLFSAAALKAYLPALSISSLFIASVVIITHLPVKSIFKDLRYFIILLFFVFVARALSTPGSPVIIFNDITITRQGMYDGALVCWRLAIVAMTGVLFISTTRPTEIKAAVEWLLSPFPFIPEKRVATMMSLIMRFLPLILIQAKEVADAQRARCIENRKNPVYRMKKLAIPIVRRIFENADELATAMEARCYSEDRTGPKLSSSRRDWIALFAVVCLCILIVEI